jgi:hypothetical protein
MKHVVFNIVYPKLPFCFVIVWSKYFLEHFTAYALPWNKKDYTLHWKQTSGKITYTKNNVTHETRINTEEQ